MVVGGDQAAIALGLVSTVIALPFRWTHPHRWREIERMEAKQPEEPVAMMWGNWPRKLLPFKPPAAPTGWVSWYVSPMMHKIMYLVNDGDGGHYYTDQIERATVYPTAEAALAPTPVYDGSAGIKTRSGVKPVNRHPTPHLAICRTCRDGGDCGAHLTFADKPANPEVTSATIVQSLFLGLCPDEQTSTIFGWDENDPIARHFKCKKCDGHWIVRLGRARHMRDYPGFDMEKIK
jgi:hypothetical protein